MQVQDLWCRLAAAESMAAAATRESLGEFALQKAAQQAKFSQGLSEQTGRLQAAHEVGHCMFMYKPFRCRLTE